MTDLSAWLQDRSAQVDRALRAWMPDEGAFGQLGGAMAHIVFSGGKRLRPALVFLACENVGGQSERAIAAAAAVELLHAYSLVHDDLPCMDDASVRRGKPCVHVVYGEAMGVLAGDGLLTLAFEVLGRHSPTDAPIGKMVADFGQAVGWSGMVGGQVLDLQAEGAEPNVEWVRAIHRGKTAALLGACLRLGSWAGGGSDDDADRLGAAGEDLGLAFQIVDDLLDLEGTVEDLGKDAGADADNDKMTWPGVVGVEQARADAKELLESARKRFGTGPAADRFAQLAEVVLSRGH
ncbi:MAG: geranylgeranyl diphosphate synthase type II [Pseudohongiellaceae bacterium]|jgi:geranylgeranyl diphosphate synthase type II